MFLGSSVRRYRLIAVGGQVIAPLVDVENAALATGFRMVAIKAGDARARNAQHTN